MSMTVTTDTNTMSPHMEGWKAKWILKQKEVFLEGPAPGTTFPPFSTHLPYFKERLSMSMSSSLDLRPKCKCSSEPDLSHLNQSESLQESDCNNHDEDYLFEFDIGSPASDGGSDDLESDLDSNTVINVIEGEGTRRFSISSDSSSSCTHRKENGGSTDGFSSIFGSISSGLGSDRRCSQDDVRLEGILDDQLFSSSGLSVAPSMWKENCALYLGSNGVTDQEGSATPILAASPQVDSPIVSPDSCLDQESILDDQNLCIECASAHSFQTQHGESPSLVETDDNLENTVTREDDTDSDISNIEQIETIIEPSIAELEIDVSSPTPEPEKVEINSGLHVSTDKLNTLLRQLEVDKLYPNQEEDDFPLSLTPIQSHDSVQERPKLRKCSSLKTSRTPPVTTGGRKIVRFADILGLDLSQVKIFSDQIPRIPKAAFEDLDVNMSDYEVGSPISKQSFLPNPTPAVTTTSLVPMFNQPGGESHFFQTLMDRKICLENAFMDGPSAVFGVVSVLNISFHKSVTVKWTVNDWSTVTETRCQYVKGSSKGNTDKFSFKLVMASLPVGSRVQFCLKYDCEGEHWDSNGGNNYVFQVFLNSGRQSVHITKPQPMTWPHQERPFLMPNTSNSPSQTVDDPWL
eukprot:TRINITY_DN909_c0_g1_i10.p1 TRINITY_DN909_c0_g1~~TRINITY_DN909_c0_g1_i10.p1  ORF type:complete len:632 (-),score=221.93 TRINITY_DN909_c0_g1_i10:191-2086(-)